MITAWVAKVFTMSAANLFTRSVHLGNEQTKIAVPRGAPVPSQTLLLWHEHWQTQTPPYPSPRKHTPSFCVFGPTGIYTPVSPLSLTSPHRVIPSEGKQQKYFFCFKIQLFGAQISNRTRPRALVQNQHTRELCLCYVFQALINFLCVDSLGHRYTGSLFTNTSIGRKKTPKLLTYLLPLKWKTGKGCAHLSETSPLKWKTGKGCTHLSETSPHAPVVSAPVVSAAVQQLLQCWQWPLSQALETSHWKLLTTELDVLRSKHSTGQLSIHYNLDTGLSPQQALNRTTLNTSLLLNWTYSSASTQQDSSQYITTCYWTFSAASTQQDSSQYITTLLLDFLCSKHSAGQLSTQACYWTERSPQQALSRTTLNTSLFGLVSLVECRVVSKVAMGETKISWGGWRGTLSGGKIFVSWANFPCWPLFRYLFHPCVTAVACERSQSFCQKCRWQVTVKHACTLHVWLCMMWWGAWLYKVYATHWDGSRFMWYQPCQCHKYTILVDIQKRAIKKEKTEKKKSQPHTITCKHRQSAQEWKLDIKAKSTTSTAILSPPEWLLH